MVKNVARIPSSQGLIEPGAPDWANRLVLRLIKQFVSSAPVNPQQLWATPSSGLPPASENIGCIAYTTDLGLVVSNGTAWTQTGTAAAGRGALVTRSVTSAALAIGTGSPVFGAYIPWDVNTFDTDGIHSTTTNTTRLVVPAGVSRVRCRLGINGTNSVANDMVFAAIDKNNTGSGSVFFIGQAVGVHAINATQIRLNVSTPVMPVVPGDWFEARLYDGSNSTATATVATSSWFSMEIVQ